MTHTAETLTKEVVFALRDESAERDDTLTVAHCDDVLEMMQGGTSADIIATSRSTKSVLHRLNAAAAAADE